ncbi:MAG: hypothetical protein ACXW1W_18990 [Methylococcaceae bacterium]
MSDNDKQSLLLIAVEHLIQQHYQSAPNPCIALSISRYYRLLANANSRTDKQEKYTAHAKQWLACYINNSGYPPKIQDRLHDLVQFPEFNPLFI